MLERDISREAIFEALFDGVLIEEYPDDTPFPSGLFFHLANEGPLHVVVAFDSETRYAFIITAYRHDLGHFEPDYKTRRRHE